MSKECLEFCFNHSTKTETPYTIITPEKAQAAFSAFTAPATHTHNSPIVPQPVHSPAAASPAASSAPAASPAWPGSRTKSRPPHQGHAAVRKPPWTAWRSGPPAAYAASPPSRRQPEPCRHALPEPVVVFGCQCFIVL